MILLAAGSIAWTAIPRLLHPKMIEQVVFGLVISTGASLINLGVSRILLHAGKRYDSITLEADARHLMTDVITTFGVIAAVVMVSVTGWSILDPLIALGVSMNILFTGVGLIRRSVRGLLDASLPAHEIEKIETILQPYRLQGVKFHALRTRSAAAQDFVSLHVLVPRNWSVKRAHALAGQIETDIRQNSPQRKVFTHIEPLDDPEVEDF
jgi:cation diffusion facilitator family transporter